MLLIHLGENGDLIGIFGTWEDASRMVNSETNLPHIFAVSTDGVDIEDHTVLDPDTRLKELVKEAIREKEFEECEKQFEFQRRMFERYLQ